MIRGMDEQRQRWNFIDLIEVIGILFVLMYHSTTYYFNILDKSLGLFLKYYLRTVLSMCVPLFFFANGYLLINRKFDFKKHINKLVRIVILTFIWGIGNVLLYRPIEDEYMSIVEIVKHILVCWPECTKHLWYMGALICIYVFFPFLKIAYDNNKQVFCYLIIIIACFTFGNTIINHVVSILSGLMGKGNEVYRQNWFGMFNPFRGIYGYAFVYFCVGGMAYDIKNKLETIEVVKRNVLAIVAIIFSSMLLFGEGVYFTFLTGEVWDVVCQGYDTVFTFISVCALFVLSLSYNKEYKCVKLISCNILGIYFIHDVIIHMLRPFVKEISLMDSYIGGLVFAVIVLMISLIVVLFLKQIPVVKQLFII